MDFIYVYVPLELCSLLLLHMLNDTQLLSDIVSETQFKVGISWTDGMIWCLKWRNGTPTWPLKWVHQHLNMVLVITQLVTFKRLAMILANISQAHPFEGDRGRGLCFIMSITHVSMYSSQCIRWQPISGFSVYKKGWLVPRSNWYYLEHVFSHIHRFPQGGPATHSYGSDLLCAPSILMSYYHVFFIRISLFLFLQEKRETVIKYCHELGLSFLYTMHDLFFFHKKTVLSNTPGSLAVIIHCMSINDPVRIPWIASGTSSVDSHWVIHNSKTCSLSQH